MTKNYDTQSFPRSSYFEWNRYRFPSSRLERVPPIRPLLNYSNRRKYAVQLAATSPYFPFTPFTETRVFPSHAFSTYLFLTSNFIESFIVSFRSPISEVISIFSLFLSFSVIVQRVIQSPFNFRLIKFKFFERERQRIRFNEQFPSKRETNDVFRNEYVSVLG